MINRNLVRAHREAQHMDAALLACIPYPNPRDWNLSKILCHTANDEYVVWTYNAIGGGFHQGHYHRDLRDALNTLAEKMAELTAQ